MINETVSIITNAIVQSSNNYPLIIYLLAILGAINLFNSVFRMGIEGVMIFIYIITYIISTVLFTKEWIKKKWV